MNNPYKNTEGKVDITEYKRTDEVDVLPKKLELDAHGQQVLIASKGWIRFLSVIGFIFFAVLLLALLGTVIAFGSAGGLALGLVSLILMVVITIITFKLANGLSKVASAINHMMITRQPIDFEILMVEQMKFWGVFGILNLIFGVMLVLLIFVG